MPILLLQMVGPMQSWGITSRFDIRDTAREPSKSGVVGLLAAALGRRRFESISDLSTLRMTARIDCEGVMTRDFHTILNVPKASGAQPGTVVSERYYLADAAFLIALEHDNVELLGNLDQALQCPHWFLALGRRSFPPAVPVRPLNALQLHTDLDTILREFPCLGRGRNGENNRKRVVRELRSGEEPKPNELRQSRPDQPISFQPPRHTLRDVAVGFVEVESEDSEESSNGKEDAI